jgi:hypothetical protein
VANWPAVDTLEESVQLCRSLLEGDPGNAAARRNLAVPLHALGLVHRDAGRSTPAAEALTESVRLLRAVLKGDPGNANYQRDFDVALKDLGGI